ncbi:hypothetical protein SFB2_145G1, partial [Candidatus Arthromitus sp. SFB-2]
NDEELNDMEVSSREGEDVTENKIERKLKIENISSVVNGASGSREGSQDEGDQVNSSGGGQDDSSSTQEEKKAI